MKASPILSNFTSGELSPRLEGRVDIQQYFNGCRTLKNMIVHPHGGASKRYGTHFVAETKASATTSRLIPFIYGSGQAYALEFGDGYFRVFYNEGQIASPAGTPVEYTTPYTAAEVHNLKWVQDEDVMYIFHPTGSTIQRLTRHSHYAWNLSTATFVSAPSEWASTYPTCGAIYEQRLFLGGKQKIWGSVPADYENFSTGAADDDAVEYQIAAEEANIIHWMVSARYLNIGTSGGAWIMSSGTDDAAITPSKVKVRREEKLGVYNLQASLLSNAVIYLSRAQRKVRQFLYDYASDSHDSDDLTQISEHITEGGLTGWAFAAEPDSILWTVRSDGHFPAMTYERKQKVIAWHDHETDGEVVSVCSLPEDDHDQLWMIVKREINGVDRYYVEFMENDFGTDLNAAWFVDSGLSYSGAAASTVSGLNHLEGKQVAILADGAVAPLATVTAGAVSLPWTAQSITVGLPFTSVLEPMRLEYGSADGTAQGKKKKISKVIARLYRTVGCEIGSEEDKEDRIYFRTPADAMSSFVPLFSDDKEITFRGGWDTDGFIRIKHDQPLPMTVISIMPKVTTNG